MTDSISAQQTVVELLENPLAAAWIDVRSEGEFREGSIAGFKSLPILNDMERAEVGTTYKRSGPSAAVALGHNLVEPSKHDRIRAWSEAAHGSQTHRAMIACWRGGLRSQIACQWLREAGGSATQVVGGYKALRSLLLQELAKSHPMNILAGWTGSGKTDLLHEFNNISVDLEGLAAHRGSAFGRWISKPQPSQATFENTLALEFLKRATHLTLVEDESAVIGAIALPAAVRRDIVSSSVIFIDEPVAARAYRLYHHYVAQPLDLQLDVGAHLIANLAQLKKRLGGLLHHQIEEHMHRAFQSQDTRHFELHQNWITLLLTEHYDKLYRSSFEKLNRPVLFRGSMEECRQWIQNTFDSQKPYKKVDAQQSSPPALSETR